MNLLTRGKNVGNSVSECSILKIFWGAYPQSPLGACTFGAHEAPCGAKKHFLLAAFATMSTTLQIIIIITIFY